MEEAYLYFSAATPHAGNGKVKTDYTGNNDGSTQDLAVHAVAGNALASKSATTYLTPVASGCAKNYIIYISNGAAQDNNSDITQATSALTTAGGSTTLIPLNPSGSQDNVADEWARFMKQSSLGISVYTVDVDKVTTGQGPGWTALLESIASVSSGKYFSVSSNGSEIVDALNGIFSEIQSVNSVFASVSLPISVNTQGTYLNQVYIGMFRPDQDAAPRWAGNIKQYKVGYTSQSFGLQDADNHSAINNQTGFVSECARSFWTPSSVNTAWVSRPQGDCLTVANSKSSDYPDGNVVEKGAQAYQLRASDTRTVNTCSSSACTGLTNFDSDYVTATMLGVISDDTRRYLIDWAVGKDVRDEDHDGVTTAERRLSIHGDVIHSRPVAINFGSASSPQVVVFYGGNDGLLRSVNGNRTAAIGSIPAGGELWSFIPPEFYTKIKRLVWNQPQISFPNSTAHDPLPKPYGVDGPVTAFDGDIAGANKKIIYATMRRGGRSVYAFDVTNSISSPGNPSLKWKIGCPNAGNDTGCTTDMSGVGQTWSSLKSLSVVNYSSGAPLMIFGGGYDTCEDIDNGTANNTCTSTSKGHYVYVIDANTGVLVRAFDTGGYRGVVADATIVLDTNGKAIYAYTADLGGNVYRISFGGTTSADWTMTKIAALGCNDPTAACSANRKFMYAPSVVATGGNYVILLGSGDREKPLTYYTATNAVVNHFFMFTDKPTVAATTWPGNADGCGSTIICKASLFGIAQSSTDPTATELAGIAAKKGWYLNLSSTEQVVTSAVTVFGVVTFSTHQPAVVATDSCSSNLGNTRVYNIAYTDAKSANSSNARYLDVIGDGLPPSPIVTNIILDSSDGGRQVVACFGCGEVPIDPVEKTGSASVAPPKGRLYWYIQK